MLLVLVATLLVPWVAAIRAREPGGSRLVLGAGFDGVEFREMPAPPLAHRHFTKRDYPAEHAVEWQVRLQGPRGGDAPLFENVKSADFVVQFPVGSAARLHWSRGSHQSATDFQPRMDLLAEGRPVELESFGGRSSDGVMPYFNLASDGGGVIVAVGWTGDWKASFTSLGAGRVRVEAGLKRSKFKLPAGEEVRLPSVLVMTYRGAWLDGQNQFRRLMLRHFTPGGRAPMELMPVAASVHGMIGFNDTTEEKLVALAGDIAALKLPLDTFWLDAGWTEGGFPSSQGNPLADPRRFPKGLAPVGEAARKGGMRFLAWFEPERAMRGTWLEKERPGWLLTPSGTPPDLRYMETDGFRLLDLGNPDARAWAVESVSKHIREAGISVYRQDFNLYPSYFWHTGEVPNTAGLREIRHISGLYDFLDELQRRHPGLIIDNCASGGRRSDFEMMRRSVMLWRSDSCWDAESYPRNVQAMTHGLSHWLPLHGLGSVSTSDVALRSGMGACASYAASFRDAGAVTALRAHLARYLKVRPLFAADFHPLTEWSEDPTEWLAFQFHDPATGEGVVQAFHGANPTQARRTLKLRGLAAEKLYAVTDWDAAGEAVSRSGEELANGGIEVRAAAANGAFVYQYRLRDAAR
jgi:alpha-galactosidase